MSAYTTFTLNDGGFVPSIAIGTGTTFKDGGDKVTQALVDAVKKGYRLIDTALIYNTEENVGKAIAQLISQGIVNRQDLFVTSKIPPFDISEEKMISQVDKCLKRLGVDYVDCMMIHWPSAPLGTSADDDDDLKDQSCDPVRAPEVRIAMWQALQKCVEAGKIKHLGVSNFGRSHIEALVNDPRCHIMPALNQIEFNPYCVDKEIIGACRAFGIVIQAYAPLGSGLRDKETTKIVLNDPTMKDISQRIGCSVAQLCIAWALKQKVAVVTKTENRSRMDENFNSRSFVEALTPEDVAKIDALNLNLRKFWKIYNQP